MTHTDVPDLRPQLFAMRVLALAMMGALPTIGVTLLFVIGNPLPVPGLIAGALVAGGVVVHLLCELALYRLPSIDPGTPPEEAAPLAAERFRVAMITRFAVCESIALVAVTFSFAFGTGYLVYVVGMLVSLALLGCHVYPWTRPIRRSVAALEMSGAKSWLPEAWRTGTGPDGQQGAIIEL